MMNRRTWLQTALAGVTTTALPNVWAQALANSGPILTRAIPSSGQRLPIIGLGSSATFAQVARTEDREALKNVMAKMVELGGTVFDTAPSYGASEEVAGQIAQNLGIAQKLFWATKLNVAPRGGGAADAAAARAQLETSFKRIGKPVIDLIQIHNMGDIQTQLPILREAKEKGRIRYLGITTTFSDQYASMIDTMRTQKLDFIGTNYAIDDLFAEQTILPLAQERGIGVLVYAPFGRTRLWSRVKGQTVPEWAKEFDATTWAQFFLKFVASHPAVTCITPATSRVSNMVDNMAGGVGRLPDAAMRKRMIQLINSLPNA
ncbi:aldo/keto reductase [Zwartia panacis]|jgi:aryl-alcohol dehydrogenase-like predicted oxidoreductase|uniref:aldo/keto reductase n=1 Tax=Zwartia panacis TaxID=2683345 RepID=UPI0025B38A55|nr:aldo/keto reductase [Zwartia panacis]MDN4017953.1 aldo/keto reductase [Zwartia panacis]